MKHLKLALRVKMKWNIAIEEDREWVKVCKPKYLNNKNHFLRISNPPYGSPFSNEIIKIKVIGNGEDIIFWENHWTKNRPLMSWSKLNKAARWIKERKGAKIKYYFMDKNGT